MLRAIYLKWHLQKMEKMLKLDEGYFSIIVYLLRYQALQLILGCQLHRFLPVIKGEKIWIITLSVNNPDSVFCWLTCWLVANSLLLVCIFYIDVKHTNLFTHYNGRFLQEQKYKHSKEFIYFDVRHVLFLTFSPTPPIEPIPPGGPCAPCGCNPRRAVRDYPRIQNSILKKNHEYAWRLVK